MTELDLRGNGLVEVRNLHCLVGLQHLNLGTIINLVTVGLTDQF